MSYMISAANFLAEFDVGKAQTCSNEVVVVGQEVAKAPTMSGRGYWSFMVALVLWALISQILAVRAIWKALRGMFGAMRPGPTPRTRTTRKRTSDAHKDMRVEVYHLDGLTVQGLQALCARFGLKRNGLRSELIERINAAMDVRCARCASERQ